VPAGVRCGFRRRALRITQRALEGEAIVNKRMMWALLGIGVLVVVLVFNRGEVEVDLLVARFKWVKSLVFLGFTAAGVVIGVLLR